MQTSDRVLAHRYSRAFFQSAAERKEEEKAYKELIDAYKGLHDKMNKLSHPAGGAVRQKVLLKNALGAKVGPGTLRFLELLIDKKRFGLLPLIVSDYGRILDEQLGILRAQVRSASALSAKEQETLVQKLKAFSGKEVSLEIKTDPELLGGMVVRLGDWVLDGSLKGKLKQLGQRLVEA